MFRSVAQAEADLSNIRLTADEEDHESRMLRREVSEYIKSKKNEYNTLWKIIEADISGGKPLSHNEYVKKIRQVDDARRRSTYGTELELRVLSLLLDRNICVTTDGRTGYVVGPIDGSSPRSKRMLYLHLNGLHYTPYLKNPRPVSPIRVNRYQMPVQKAEVFAQTVPVRTHSNARVNPVRVEALAQTVPVRTRSNRRVRRKAKRTVRQPPSTFNTFLQQINSSNNSDDTKTLILYNMYLSKNITNEQRQKVNRRLQALKTKRNLRKARAAGPPSALISNLRKLTLA